MFQKDRPASDVRLLECHAGMNCAAPRRNCQPRWVSPGDEETRLRLTRPAKMLLLSVSALVLIDTVFFTALTSLLPHHSHAAHPAKSGAGIFVAGYPAALWAARFPEDCSQPAWLPDGGGTRAGPDEHFHVRLRPGVRRRDSRRGSPRPGPGRGRVPGPRTLLGWPRRPRRTSAENYSARPWVPLRGHALRLGGGEWHNPPCRSR